MAQPENEVTVARVAAPALPAINVADIEKADWGRDPFTWNANRAVPRPTQQARVVYNTTEPAWLLTAIVFTPNHPMAIVNGKTVSVGDVVNNAEVVKIDRTRVTLRYNGGTFAITTRKG